MTKSEAVAYVREHGDDDPMGEEELAEVFTAIYDRPPDGQDRADGLWSLCCVASDGYWYIDRDQAPNGGRRTT
ncbi:MAG: hypothetical protein ABFD94_06780 [Armatimonadia bacterium]